jgi:excinuclease ABC subunit C
MSNLKELKSKIAALPEVPGVYIFKDAQGQIIYIGKAKSLKKRVQSYFSRELDAKTQSMVVKIAGFEYRLAPSESQAQILEAALIKEHLPQYNIDLKDDKSFPWIRITNEEFPAITIYRKKGERKDDASLYYGPYTNVKLLRQAVKLMRRIFGFRSCKNMPDKACLYGRLNLCPAPCIGEITSSAYKEIINRIKLFLESRYEELLDELTQKMQRLADEENFEEAARTRDQINALSAIGQGGAG